MSNIKITEQIKYIGANDKTLDLFESQYKIPNGVSYNSYLILDEKIAVMDTVDTRATGEWLRKMNLELAGREPDYLVVSHMEPDHAANIQLLSERFPQMKIVANAKTVPMMGQFFTMDFADRVVTVAEGDTLELGKHTLQFFMAPMVHWPEVMVAYEQSEKILFSADGFGKFGSLDAEEEWLGEARRYFINIVGKYGNPVQNLLKKAATLDIQMIAPLHGPILKEDLGYYIGKYLTWSSYEPEEEGILLAYASIHGNTRIAAEKMAGLLEEAGAKKVVLMDLARDDMAQAVANAFRFDKMVLASPTYDGGLFPCMEDFLHHLKAKSYQKRTVALIENGSWGPMAAKCMRGILGEMKDITVLDDVVTIKSSMKPENVAQMRELAEKIV
ncbi:MAG: FprA family A-type flavoprotein [Lachnospiraceae bacterium]|nr:FprA family A-type flavoprotein [Lachnospiraceae bacterium]